MGRRNREKACRNAKLLPEKPHALIKFALEPNQDFKDRLTNTHVGKFHWVIHVYRGVILDEEYVVFDLFCHSIGDSWNIETDTEIQIGKTHPPFTVGHHFEQKKNGACIPTLMKWSEFTDPSMGYTENGRAVFEVRIFEVPKKVIKNASAMHKEYAGIKNLEIAVGKSRFHVNRELLAATGKFFLEELKAGKLSQEGPYVLEDIAPVDFKLYLDLIYQPQQYFSGFFAKDMLVVAKRFDNIDIITACQNVVMEDLKKNRLSHKDKSKLGNFYDAETVKELFANEVAMPRHTDKPRFMEEDEEDKKRKERLMRCREILSERMRNHVCATKTGGECNCLDSDIDDIELEVEEEDIDTSQPSTSGISY